jgi:hypothetical protein
MTTDGRYTTAGDSWHIDEDGDISLCTDGYTYLTREDLETLLQALKDRQ